MLTIALAAAYSVLVLQSNEPPVTVRADASVHAVAPAPDRTDAIQHLASARRAVELGQFDIARREYVISAALDRDVGLLPVEATHGLVRVLYAQSYNREAAIVLGALASEAELKGAADVEAAALLDAIWLNIDGGQRPLARQQALRLQTLLKNGNLSAETVSLVRARYK